MPRKKQHRSSSFCRVSQGTQAEVKYLASLLGYTYNKEGSIGQLLDAIAKREVIIIKSDIQNHPDRRMPGEE